MNTYDVEPRNGFFSAIAAMSAHEIRPGNTVTLLHEVDLTDVEMLRARIAAGGGRKPSYTALVLKAVALALREFPYANRRVFPLPFFGRRIQRFRGIDAAVACERNVADAPMTAFVDLIREADKRSLTEITERLRAFAVADENTNKQWRDFKLLATKLPAWLAGIVLKLPTYFPGLWVKYRGGSFLVSSPAKYGVDQISGAWPWPLGVSFGVVKQRPVVRNGHVVARPTFIFTLNFDRRVMAGAQAAKFFKRITDILENAEKEMNEASRPSKKSKQRSRAV